MANSYQVGRAAVAIAVATVASLLVAIADPAPRAETRTERLAREETPRLRRSVAADHMRVLDGDTLEDTRDDTTYRIVNIDTPETGLGTRCAAERELGLRATTATRALISRAQRAEVLITGRFDRYGRSVAFIILDGRDMGETLIAAGLARPWRGRREPWCDANGNLIP